MARQDLKTLLEEVAGGNLPVDEALSRLEGATYVDVGGALLDMHREARTGGPEIIYAEGKDEEQIERIATHYAASGDGVLFTRLDGDQAKKILHLLPGSRYDKRGRVLIHPAEPRAELGEGPTILSAGSSDAAVVTEIAVTLEHLGRKAETIEDCGVAGLHRLLAHLPRLRKARCVIVVAGMDGALPSVVSGLVRAPMIAVPTSVGYGPGGNGVTPLLAMLHSCAPGLTVVNVDNGVGAAFAAHRILDAVNRAREA